jgi:hypothetical protein
MRPVIDLDHSLCKDEEFSISPLLYFFPCSRVLTMAVSAGRRRLSGDGGATK